MTIKKRQDLNYELDVNNFIKNINREFYLKVDKNEFSPVVQISAFLVLKHLGGINKKGTNNSTLFFFSFPNKKLASLWLSICLLTNYFNEDYYESEGKAVENLEVGKKYLIYGSVGRYKGKVTKKDDVKFKFEFDENGIKYCKSNIKSIVQNVNQSRKLNKANHYSNKKRQAKNNRSVISKILEPTEGVIINEQVLTSKILLVSGRGNTASIKKNIDKFKVYDEPISKVYSPNDNIILKPDLKDFKSFFDQNHQRNIKCFLEWVDRLIDDPKLDENILSYLIEIKASIVEMKETITSEIDAQFTDFVEEYSDIEPRLRKLVDVYPGISSKLPDKLKAVIINDINQIEEYPDTIKGFLQRKIPVIFTSNRMIEKSSDLSFYNQLFNPKSGNWKDAYRINWNRSKVNALIEVTDPDEDFIDNELWGVCKRYARQTIKIDISDEPKGFNLDEKIRYLQQIIINLEGFENLKTAFFHYLYPVLYAFKNSKKVDNSIHSLIEEFKEVWEINREYLSNNNFIHELQSILNQLQSKNFENSKSTSSEDTFSNKILIPEYDPINIPVSSETNLPNQQTEKIIFTGFPFREFSDKYLQETCLKYFVPKITVACWPHEGNLTFNYLKRRIESGYFFDNIPDNISFPEELILNNQTEIENEIKTIFEVNNMVGVKEEETIQTENDLISIDNFQYEKYKYVEHDSDKFKYSVQCNIVRFNDGYFLFLPNQSTVLSEFENESGRVSIRKLKFNQLSKGLRVFKVAQDQVNYAELLQGNQEIDKAKADLELWRTTLLCLAEHFNSVQTLSNYLLSIAKENNIKDANPDKNNLRRWLNDEDMIAPNVNNLRVIIDAGKTKGFIQGDIEKLVAQISKAYNFINKTHISLGHQVKSAIANQLKKSTSHDALLELKVQSLNIDIEAKTILELQESEIEVEYYNTRKFLC